MEAPGVNMKEVLNLSQTKYTDDQRGIKSKGSTQKSGIQLTSKKIKTLNFYGVTI